MISIEKLIDVLNFILYGQGLKAGMHNIRPEGKMWPAKACNLARDAQILFILLSFVIITSFVNVKAYNIWPLNIRKKLFCPTWDLRCAPLS